MNNPNLRTILFFPRRIVWLILTFLVMTVIIFVFWWLGMRSQFFDVDESTGSDAGRLRQLYGLDRPIGEQYAEYLSGVLRGDFGKSFIFKGQPVAEVIDERLPSTMRLLGLATLVGMVLSVFIILPGVLVLWVRDKIPILGALLHRLGQIGVTLAAAIPAFLLGLFLLYIFSLKLRWLPVAGWADLRSGDNFNLKHAILPTLTLAALPTYLVARSVLGEIAHYQTAVEKRGLFLIHIVLSFFRYGLIQLIGMLGGVLFVEAVFSLPGVGRLFLQSILNRDYPMIVGLVSSFLIWALIIRALADLVQGIDGFVWPKLQTAEPEAETPTPGETLTYAKVLSVVWLVLCVLLIVIPLLQGVGGLLTAGDSLYKQTLRDNLLPPGSEGVDGSVYAWGTDMLGRDVRSRVRYALGVDLVSSLLITLAVLIPALLGGLLASYLAKRKKIWADLLDDLVMFPVEVLTSIPGLILLAFILAIMGPGLRNLLIWLTLVFLLPRGVRMARNWWVAAASPEKAIWSRLGGIALGVLVLGTGLAAVTQPAIGFLGLGASPPQPDLGFMGMQTMSNAPHIVLRTGQTLFFAVFGWFLLADTVLSKFGIHQREGWLELNR